MSISGIPAAAHHRRDDLRAMAKAIDSGDIGSAQSALSSLQQQGGLAGSPGPLGLEPPPKIKSDLSALTTAVQSGNIGDAQNVLKTLREDARQSVQSDPPPPPPLENVPDGASNSNGVDPVSSLLKSLVDVLKDLGKGDGDKLQTDLQAFERAAKSAFGDTDPAGEGDGDQDDTAPAVHIQISFAVQQYQNAQSLLDEPSTT